MPAPPVVRLLAAVVLLVVFLCFMLVPAAPLVRGADILVGEREPLPTDVELAGAGILLFNYWQFYIENTYLQLAN